MKILFIADFFAEQVLGGGELNNEELISILASKGHQILKTNSHFVTPELLSENRDANFIIANFINMSPELIPALYDKNYIIYEHDHKYLSTRNPGVFPDFVAPKEHVVNIDFYKNAAAVLCQSKLHSEIAHKNADLDNIVNLGGNIWDLESLKFMSENAKIEKNDTYAVMDSNIKHKNTVGAIRYCNAKGYDYNLVESSNYREFLSLLGVNKSLVFLPQTPETLSRVIVEARMMNMGVVTNRSVGAASEEWYNLKGHDLIRVMHSKREEIANKVLEILT